jgi:hypothetical protein
MNAIFVLYKTLVCFEGLAALIGFLTWTKWKHTYLKWFPVYLATITFIEISYYVLCYLQQYDKASLVQQLAVIIEMLFISWFFYQTLGSNQKKVIIAGGITYIVTLVLEKMLLRGSYYYFQSLSYTIGTLFILLYLILFFINLARSEQILGFVKLTKFWMALGMLLFYLGCFPFYGLYNELAKNIELFIPLAIITLMLNHTMYSFFAIGFIWGKPR